METARCLAFFKDKSAEKILDYAIFSLGELSKKRYASVHWSMQNERNLQAFIEITMLLE